MGPLIGFINFLTELLSHNRAGPCRSKSFTGAPYSVLTEKVAFCSTLLILLTFKRFVEQQGPNHARCTGDLPFRK
jgi:hypothetical protein